MSATNRTITYTGFDLPSKITRSEIPNGGGQITASIDLAYSPERARIKRTETVNNVRTTTWTVGGVEFIARNGTTKPTETKRYLGNLIQTRKADVYGAITVTTDVLLTDPLGSIDVLLPVNNGAIGTPTRMSFDAFGQRRTSSTTALSLWAQSTYDLTRTTRGYTGHEQLDSVALVHMNGRIYDPRTARFVQADPIISNLFDSQSHNRYSYVMNRPLSLVDPSGFIATLPTVPVTGSSEDCGPSGCEVIGTIPCASGWTCLRGDNPLARMFHDMLANQRSQVQGAMAFVSTNGLASITMVLTPNAHDLIANPLNIANDATLGDDILGVTEGLLDVLQAGYDSNPLNWGSSYLLESAGISYETPKLTDRGQNGKAAFEFVTVVYGAYKTAASFGPMRLVGTKPPIKSAGIVAKDGTVITGLTKHGVDRVIGDGAKRAGTKPDAILDAVKNPTKVKEGVDSQGRPFKVYSGRNARVVINPENGKIISTNPLSRDGAHLP